MTTSGTNIGLPSADELDPARPVAPATPAAQPARPAPSTRQIEVGRVWLLGGAIALLALALLRSVLPIAPLPLPPFTLPWWALALMFFCTESGVIRTRYRSTYQVVALNEIPLVLGLFFARPPELLLGLLLGSVAAVLRRRRQSPLQLFFNTSLFFLGGVVSILIFHYVVQPDRPLEPLTWAGAVLAAMVLTTTSHAAITTATVLSGTRPQMDRLGDVLAMGLASSVTATMVGLVAATSLWRDPRSAVLLVFPALMAFLAYRGFQEERTRHDTFDQMYESTRMLHRAPEVDKALVGLLTQARQMFRADLAEITLFSIDEDEPAVRTSLGPGAAVSAMVPVPVSPEERLWTTRLPRAKGVFYPESGELVAALGERGITEAMTVVVRHDDHLVANILVANRIGGLGHFDHTDLELFETLADDVARVLGGGSLEASLLELRELEARLRHQAYHDPLTSLPNRAQFIEDVEASLDAGGLDRRFMGVVLIDLDDFKVVNDSRGPTIGDRLLVAVAERLTESAAGATVARLGGDEFGVLVATGGAVAAGAIADQMLESVRRPLVVEGEQLRVRASAGVAMGDSGRWADELLRNADVAMYTAKAAGKNRYEVFSQDMHVAVMERHELMADLQRAVDRGEFLLHYQPIVDLPSGRVAGFEALVRWRHPLRGMVSPVHFIPLAEETGLIVPIGRSILEMACAQVRRWRDEFTEHRDLYMSVNVSGRQMEQDSFVGDTVQVIAESRVAPSALLLEITESVLMADPEANSTKLAQLKSLGLRLAMDDFGTGYSSLAFLQRLPIDVLKIAKEFVDGLGHPDDEVYAHAIVGLGQTVGKKLIAEGVERDDQLVALRGLGCDFGQGYLFSPAVDAAAAAEFLRHGLAPSTTGKVIPFPA